MHERKAKVAAANTMHERKAKVAAAIRIGVVVIAGFSLGSARVFSGYLPALGTLRDISWRMGPEICAF